MIVVIIAGNPRGLISCHHEKLVLIDPECPAHTLAFTGGFDIATGRFDHSDHKLIDFNSRFSSSTPEYLKRVSLLWHDTQVNLFIYTSKKGKTNQFLRCL